MYVNWKMENSFVDFREDVLDKRSNQYMSDLMKMFLTSIIVLSQNFIFKNITA